MSSLRLLSHIKPLSSGWALRHLSIRAPFQKARNWGLKSVSSLTSSRSFTGSRSFTSSFKPWTEDDIVIGLARSGEREDVKTLLQNNYGLEGTQLIREAQSLIALHQIKQDLTMNGTDSLQWIMNELNGNLWEGPDTTEDNLKEYLGTLFKESPNTKELEKYLRLFPRSRFIKDKDTFSVDFRLCNYTALNDYDKLLHSFKSGRPIVSVVGVSGCSKTSSLLKAASNYYVIFMEFGKEFNDTNTERLIRDIESGEYYGGYFIDQTDPKAYTKNCQLWEKTFKRCKIEILARMVHLLKLVNIHTNLTPSIYRDCQLNGGQHDIGTAVQILKKLSNQSIDDLANEIMKHPIFKKTAVAIDEFQEGIKIKETAIVSTDEEQFNEIINKIIKKVPYEGRGLGSVQLHAANEFLPVATLGTSNDILRMNQIVASKHGKEPIHLTDWTTLDYKYLIDFVTGLFNLNEDTVKYAFKEEKWGHFRPRWLEIVLQRLIPTIRLGYYGKNDTYFKFLDIKNMEPNSKEQRERLKELVEFVQESDIKARLIADLVKKIDKDDIRALYSNSIHMYKNEKNTEIYPQSINIGDCDDYSGDSYMNGDIAVRQLKSGYGKHKFAVVEELCIDAMAEVLNKDIIGSRPIILSLDGGGSKGVVTAKMLTMIEEYINELRPGLKLYDIIDCMYGCSVGGLIALQLSTGYSAEQTLKFFTGDILEKLFGDYSHSQGIWEQLLAFSAGDNFIGDLLTKKSDERGERLKNIIMENMKEYALILDKSHQSIKNVNVGVLSTEISINYLSDMTMKSNCKLITNYHQSKTNPFKINDEFNILQAALVTSRDVPGALGRLYIKDDKYYMDGAGGDVNPVNYGIAECVSELGYSPGAVFSFGCGEFPNVNQDLSSSEYLKEAGLSLLNPNKAHKIAEEIYGLHGKYMRINPKLETKIDTFTFDATLIDNAIKEIESDKTNTIKPYLREMAETMLKFHDQKK